MSLVTAPVATMIVIDPPVLPTLSFLHRISVEQFHEMERLQIIPESSSLELIDGLIVERAVPVPAHESCIRRLNRFLGRIVPEEWFLQITNAIDLTDSEPIPDGAIIRGDLDEYDQRHPTAADVSVVIEVSNTSLPFDRAEKGWKYAESGIAVYWILNLIDHQMEVYTDPETFKTPASYATQTVYKPGDTVPLVLDGQTVATIPVDQLLG